MAGAFELALACDITIAAEAPVRRTGGALRLRDCRSAVAMAAPPKMRRSCCSPATTRWTRLALAIGIVNDVVPEDERSAWRTLAREIERRRPLGVLHQAGDEPHLRDHGHARCAESSLDIDIILNSTPSAEKAEFERMRKEQGLKAALAWRDARFSDGKA